MIALFLAFAVPAAPSPAAPPLRRIEIVDGNNDLTLASARSSPADAAGPSSLAPLREYVLKLTRLRAEDDPAVIVKALEWVSTQWKHDGMNEARPGESSLDILKDAHYKRARYRGVEYGQVLFDLLKSLGYVTRKVSLRSPGAAYGGLGQGHVAGEVWSNALRKWIFVDPQYSVYPTDKGRYLNFSEMYELRKQGKWDEISFNVTPGYQRYEDSFDQSEYVKDYKTYLSRYFGYVGTGLNFGTSDYTLVLELDGKAPYATFQGFEASGLVFTRRPEDMYYDINRTLLVFNYADKAEGFQAKLADLGIKTDADYLSRMGEFAAVPDFLVAFANNSPWHALYEYRLSPDEPWRALMGSELRWKLDPGENYLEARSVNEAGIPGPSTFVKIAYR